MLEIPLIASVDTLVERVEHTLRGPSIEEVPPMDEVPTIDEVPSAMTKFLDDDRP